MREAVCEIVTDARCDLILVGEIHNIGMATSTGKNLSGDLKYFAEHIPATSVYAGMTVQREGLFTGVRGKQFADRCVMKCPGSFPYGLHPCDEGLFEPVGVAGLSWRQLLGGSRCGRAGKG